MSVFHSCADTSDATSLSSSHALYLKPVARLHVSVQLPTLKTPGKSISNWEVMEKLRAFASPDEFTSLKVSKSTLEVVRFEGEIDSRSKLPAVLARLDGRSIKLSGFHESLKVRAAEAKPDFPTRHSWDSYFRDAKNMNEMKPGERPDTIHITNLPCKWFATKTDPSKPSEYILRKIFDAFGEVRCVDIPMLDPFRSQMKSNISGVKMFSNNQNMIFEAYVQYKDYMCFVKTMDTLRGMKLVHKQPDGKAFSASIKVDFDKTKHMSEGSIRRRRLERERLMAKEREREETERAARAEAERKLAEERKRAEEEKRAKLERQRQREERRKAKQLERLKRQEADEMNQKIATEERLLLMAQRRLESFRLLDELFNQLKIKKEKERAKYKDENLYRSHRNRHKNQPDGTAEQLEIKEKELREKLVKKFKYSKSEFEKVKPEYNAELKTRVEVNDEYPEFDNYNNFNNFNDQHQRGQGQRGGPRGGRRNNWFNRGRRGMMPFMNHPFPQMPFQQFPNRGFPPHRGFPRWPRNHSGRGQADPGFVPPYIPPFYLDPANDPYYKYFSKLAGFDSRRSRSLSRSLSRSSRRHSSSRSRSRSRSRRRSSRSRSRRRSRSRSRSWSRSRSRSRSRRRSRSRTRSRSRSKQKSRSRKRHSSRTRSHTSKHSDADDKRVSVTEPPEQKTDEDSKKADEKAPSVHTWSRSPSKTRSLSWEHRADEPTSSTKPHKHKKEKKKGKKKKKKKESK